MNEEVTHKIGKKIHLNQTDANWWNQREVRGGFVLVHFVLPLFNFESFDKKNQDVMIVFGTKTNAGHRLRWKNEFFFVFFCLSSHLFHLFLHFKTATTQPSKKSFSLFVLSVLSYFTTFVQTLSLCFAVWDIKIKKKKQNNLMTTLTDWHSWFYCCFLKNYHKKTNLTNVIFLWKGRMLFLEFFIASETKHQNTQSALWMGMFGLWKVPLQSFVSLSETWNRIFVTMKTNLFDATWSLSMLPLVEPKLWRYSLKVVNAKSWNSSIVWSRNAQDPTNLWVCDKSVSFLSFCFTMRVFSQSVFLTFWTVTKIWSALVEQFSQTICLNTVCFFFVRMCWLVNFRRIPSTTSFWQLANFFCKLAQQNKKSDMLTRQKGLLLLFLACLCSFSQQNVRENSSASFFWNFVKQQTCSFFSFVSSTTKEKPNNNWTKQKKQSWQYVQENKKNWKQKQWQQSQQRLSIFVTISVVMDFAENFHLFFLSRICSQTQHSSQTKQQQAQP